MTQEKIKIHMIGNAHIDPVWLWTFEEGYAEIKATFRSVLDRMKEFEEFTFTGSSAAYYKWIEENELEMFKEIKQRVKEGRWVLVGGWWVEPDCNIPSGESFVRQGLYSQRYFLEKFGVMSKVGYNVDSFGHSGMLPQILKKSGMDYYVFSRPGMHEKKIASNLFWWEGIDRTRILAFRIPFSYTDDWEGGMRDLEGKLLEAMRLSEHQGLDFMNFYGVGNHGGGPTIANLERIRQLQKKMGKERLVHSSPYSYFEEVRVKNYLLPVINDDLQYHATGCYSAHSLVKALNRKAEQRLLEAEKYSNLAYILTGLEYPAQALKESWQNVMFNQFHDILGGCSIKEAYDDARNSYGHSLNICARIINSALQKLSWSVNTLGTGKETIKKDTVSRYWDGGIDGIPVVIFNPHSFKSSVPVCVKGVFKEVKNNSGRTTVTQRVRSSRTNGDDKWDTLFEAEIPAMGYSVYRIFGESEHQSCFTGGIMTRDSNILENEMTRLTIDQKTGYIKQLYDKKNRINIFNGSGAVPTVIDETDCDTWAHGKTVFNRETGRFCNAKVKVLESGPVRGKIRSISRYGKSTLQQDYIVCSSRRGITVNAKLDWREKHKMLKLSFPVNIKEADALSEIPYGFIHRKTKGQEESGQRWLDLSGKHADNPDLFYGLAIINDSKYSFSIDRNDIRLTAVRSPVYADHFGTRDELCEFMDQGINEFSYCIFPHEGYPDKAEIIKKACEFNCPPRFIVETCHKGNLPVRFEGISISVDNVIATVFKRAEDGKDNILRCYECSGVPVTAKIEIPMLQRRWESRFERFEIKTFRIPDNRNYDVEENNLIEFHG